VLVSGEALAEQIQALVPAGVDHVVEVVFAANVSTATEVLTPGGSIATYATDDAEPVLPFGPLVFANVTIHFLGSDDFPAEAKAYAADALNAALEDGWQGFAVAARLGLDEIAEAHEWVERSRSPGKVVVFPTG
jgi:NADPH2:quinone reductase